MSCDQKECGNNCEKEVPSFYSVDPGKIPAGLKNIIENALTKGLPSFDASKKRPSSPGSKVEASDDQWDAGSDSEGWSCHEGECNEPTEEDELKKLCGPILNALMSSPQFDEVMSKIKSACDKTEDSSADSFDKYIPLLTSVLPAILGKSSVDASKKAPETSSTEWPAITSYMKCCRHGIKIDDDRIRAFVFVNGLWNMFNETVNSCRQKNSSDDGVNFCLDRACEEINEEFKNALQFLENH